ncbi:uncharacterized protein BDR25DRAFT_313817 [Lindgomyces ingoldianus]|uniref:Uncharacterized protein n=1 Tax=Lindgomyces ingoldianus TaxID=673940 RepID=A0ACB6QW16_9PLEO|nr:uncharacterized protein BDR25DRAFT_313817 [Lindgomyces ingoldianus]KAF2471193.1 hypothetical protein BDR25DRAFT_313817 [Lindgomyces ingoldianus]
MLASSSSSPLSKRNERPSRSGTPTISPPDDLEEISDVPCYTCRRRHVKCDRTLPACAKCAKKGVPCLGYLKPLRWAEGVAVRGKLKGKSQPVVDSQVVSIVQNTMQFSSNSAMQEAAHFGLHATDNSLTDVASTDAKLLELMTYHNKEMCSETVTFEQTKFINRAIAPLSFDLIQKLPKDIVNCILGNAAVHMASRQPENMQLERLALETKVNVFQSFNRLLQSPQNQQPDVIICCGILIYAMDLFEFGMSRWMVHFLGSVQVMASFGGIENLWTYYPHLQLPLTHVAHFETMWIILSHLPITKTKQASRKSVEMLCEAQFVKRKFYNPCPTPLTLVLWDVGACASRLLRNRTSAMPEDLHKREQILLDVLAFRPEDGTKDVQESYYKDIPVTEQRLRCWDLISTAWKGAVTILVLRYLFFGRPNLTPQSPIQRSRTPPIATRATSWFTSRGDSGLYQHGMETLGLGDFLEDGEGNLPENLSANLNIDDPLSRGPSPVPFSEPPTSSLWGNRYEIHNEAFSALSTSFFSLYENLDPVYLRYITLPLLILALVSRDGSAERTLCFSYFNKFKQFMVTNYPPRAPDANPYSRERATRSPSPQGGEQLEFDVPWDKLDAYSAAVEQGRQSGGYMQGDGGLTAGAPEWNWWDMLNTLKMDLVWPCTSGTSHLERGTEFWAFKLISSVVNDECFSNWTGDLTTSQGPPSS